MAKKKTAKEAVKTESAKTDAVQSAEHIIDGTLNTDGNTGQYYISSVKKALKAKGYDLVNATDESGEQLLIIVVAGKAKFQSVVAKDGKVTFDPSNGLDKKTKYQVVARYRIEKPEAEKNTESEE